MHVLVSHFSMRTYVPIKSIDGEESSSVRAESKSATLISENDTRCAVGSSSGERRRKMLFACKSGVTTTNRKWNVVVYLDVSMHNVVSVKMANTFRNLHSDSGNICRRKIVPNRSPDRETAFELKLVIFVAREFSTYRASISSRKVRSNSGMKMRIA